MMEAKEEVRARLNIEDVVGEYVQLRRAGRNFKGLSPFSSERTPSFIVSPDKQIWHDFSSNRGGDVFSFVMEVEGLDFRGALEMLARKAGVDLSQYQTAGDRGIAKKKQRCLSALDLAATYYQHTLLKNKTALEYVFKKRGLSKQVVQQFRIGYAPDAESALVSALTKRGFSQTELKEAGLLVQRRGRNGDMFRGRITIPLSDGQGQVVGFTARILKGDPNAPKYINTPQTLLYDKGRQLFGLHLAKEAIRQADKAVIVEGNLDVISSHQAAVRNVVAAAGTALTEYHLKSLSRLTQNVALAFDKDKAGVAATERAIDMAQNLGIRLTIVNLPDSAKDPDELIQQDAAAWRRATEQSQPVVDWVIERYLSLYDIKTAEGKREVTSRALGVIQKLHDAVEQEHYMELLASVTGASLAALSQKQTALIKSSDSPKRLKPIKAEPQSATVEQPYIDSLLALAMCDSGVRDALRSVDKAEVPRDEQKKVLVYVTSNQTEEIADQVPKELQSVETYVKILQLQADTRYASWSSQDRYFEAVELVKRLKKEHLKKQKDTLMHQLRQTQESGQVAQARELMQQLNNLIKEEKHAK